MKYFILTVVFGVTLSSPVNFMDLESSGDEVGSGMEDNLIPRFEDLGSGEGSGESNLVPRFDIEDLGSGMEVFEDNQEAEIKLVDEDFEGSGGDFRAAELSDGSGEEFVKIVGEIEDVTEAGSGELRFVELSSGDDEMEIIAKIEEVDDSMEANTEDAPISSDESEEEDEDEESIEDESEDDEEEVEDEESIEDESEEEEEHKKPRANFTPLQKLKETVVSTAQDIKDAKVNVVKGVLKAKQDILQAKKDLKKDITKHFKHKVSKIMRRAWARSFE